MIDVAFDFRSDTPRDKAGEPLDADAYSPTLRRYHRLLWSKQLADGTLFELDVITPGAYLHHHSALGEFRLTSDTVIPFWTKWKRMAHITGRIPPVEQERFNRLRYTIGGMMIFPGNPVEGKGTINQERGCNPKIDDRFDLTVECIRRHYLGQSSPLSATLARYSEFFALFGDFAGYVDFFHLQELIDGTGAAIRFFAPFDDFAGSPRPETLDSYLSYRQCAAQFLESRNGRIATWSRELRDASAHPSSSRPLGAGGGVNVVKPTETC